MNYRKLGLTDLSVSQLALGTMTWGEQNTEAEAHEQLDRALAAGVNFIDTAELYPIPPRKIVVHKYHLLSLTFLKMILSNTFDRSGQNVAFLRVPNSTPIMFCIC